MKSNQKLSGRATSIPTGMITAAAVSLLLTVMISAVGAILISRQWIPQESIGIWSIITLIAGTLAGGITAAGKIKRRRLQMSMIHGGIYYLLLLGTTALFFGGKFSGMGTTFTIVAIGSLAGGMVSNYVQGKRNPGRRKKTHR